MNHAQELIGSEVFDPKGDKIGKVGSVYVNDETRKPEWVTVRTGLFGTKETFVPLSGASATEQGVRVPVSRDKVKDAPQVDAEGGHMSEQEGRDLYSYYGLTPVGRREDTTAKGQSGQSGQRGMADTAAGAGGTGGSGGTGDMAAAGTGQDTSAQPMADTARTGSGGMTGAETAGAMGVAGAAGAAGMAARSRSGEQSSGTTAKSGLADTSTGRGEHQMSGRTAESDQPTRPGTEHNLSGRTGTERDMSSRTGAEPMSGSDLGTHGRTSTPQHAAETTSGTTAPQGFTSQPATAPADTGRSATTPAGSRAAMREPDSGLHTMTRSEEHLQVGTERVESGKVMLRKYVVTEEQQVRVQLSHEEVRIERRPIAEHERSSAMHSAQIGEQSREITLHAEKPVVSKVTVPMETVQMRTETVTSDQMVKGEVRKERIDVEDGSQHGMSHGGSGGAQSSQHGQPSQSQQQKPRSY